MRGRPPQAVYSFRHALIQESSYRSMLRNKRERIHRRLADLLVAGYADPSDGAAEVIAHHYEESGAAAKAIPYLHQAARHAAARSANVEAVRLLERALRLLTAMPEGKKRDSDELSLLVSLGSPRLTISGPGAPEVQSIYGRAIELCEKLPNTPHHFAAHWGWWFTSRDNREALERANRLSQLTEHLDDDELALQAHHCQWATQFCLGDYRQTAAHIARGLEIYDRGDFRLQSMLYGGHDAKSCGLGELALSQFLTGDYDRSLQSIELGVAHALSLEQTGSIRHSRDQQIMLHRFRGDAAKVLCLAEEMAAYAQEQGFRGLAAQAKVFRGWAEAKLGDVRMGVSAISEGLAEHIAINTPEDLPIYYEMAAESHGANGDPGRGLELLAKAIPVAERTGLQTWTAELFRRKGVLLLQESRDNKCEALACFDEAIKIATAQGARALLLRALCEKIHISDGSQRAATQGNLAALCVSLEEGHGYGDVIAARRLVDQKM
jgi:predicted ATPase